MITQFLGFDGKLYLQKNITTKNLNTVIIVIVGDRMFSTDGRMPEKMGPFAGGPFFISAQKISFIQFKINEHKN